MCVISEFETEKRLLESEWIEMYNDDFLLQKCNSLSWDDEMWEQKMREREESYQKKLPIEISPAENKLIENVLEFLDSKSISSIDRSY